MGINKSLIEAELLQIKEECESYIQMSRSSETRLVSHNIHEKIVGLLSVLQDISNKDDSPLSHKEVEILSHVANGFTNREIASALNLSVKTIEYHLKAVYSKLEVSNRSEAIKNAIEKKWI